jgi:hypothetical protein
MPSVAVAKRPSNQSVARPLKVLVPLIQDELSAGNRAGLEHYRAAGEMLLEAREQVAQFKWGQWLSKNFTLGKSTAYYYMKLAQRMDGEDSSTFHDGGKSMHSITRPKAAAAGVAWRPVVEATRNVDVDEFKEARQARAEEIQLHRDLALELIDIGYKALATRLHPDRGGSKDAMRRLNRVRDELKGVAETRRFE